MEEEGAESTAAAADAAAAVIVVVAAVDRSDRHSATYEATVSYLYSPLTILPSHSLHPSPKVSTLDASHSTTSDDSSASDIIVPCLRHSTPNNYSPQNSHQTLNILMSHTHTFHSPLRHSVHYYYAHYDYQPSKRFYSSLIVSTTPDHASDSLHNHNSYHKSTNTFLPSWVRINSTRDDFEVALQRQRPSQLK